MDTTGPEFDPALGFADVTTALINTVQGTPGGFTTRHLRVQLAYSACLIGNPSQPSSHDHEQCRAASTGRRAAEALWEILDEVEGNGPAVTERITASLYTLHKARATEDDQRHQQ
jgi:hypothetical protein